MNWAVLILGVALGVIAGAAARAKGPQRPHWPRTGRLALAASFLPALILLLAVGGIAWILLGPRGSGENMTDLALVVTASIGLLFALLTFGGGMIGAGLVDKERP